MVEKRFEKLGMPDIERFENYLPTAFNSELTLLQKVNKIIFDLMETNKLTNEMVDYLNRFIEKFDENLYQTVSDVLIKWAEDGIFKELLDKWDAFFKEKYEELETKYAKEIHNIKKLGVPVTWFEEEYDPIKKHTTMFNEAIKLASNLGLKTYVPDGDYWIEATDPDHITNNYLKKNNGGIIILDNTTLLMSDNANIHVIPNEDKAYNLINCYNKTNVKILGGNLIGDRDNNVIDRKGEWGYGIAVQGGSNIEIKDVHISNMWGDGVNIQRCIMGEAPTSYYPENVLIENIFSDNNRRQGLSLEEGSNIVIRKSTFSNTNGTAPEAGIDVEPAWVDSKDVPICRDITIEDCNFYNNNGSELLIKGSIVNESLVVKDITVLRNTFYTTNKNETKTGVAFNCALADNILFMNNELLDGQFIIVNGNGLIRLISNNVLNGRIIQDDLWTLRNSDIEITHNNITCKDTDAFYKAVITFQSGYNSLLFDSNTVTVKTQDSIFSFTSGAKSDSRILNNFFYGGKDGSSSNGRKVNETINNTYYNQSGVPFSTVGNSETHVVVIGNKVFNAGGMIEINDLGSLDIIGNQFFTNNTKNYNINLYKGVGKTINAYNNVNNKPLLFNYDLISPAVSEKPIEVSSAKIVVLPPSQRDLTSTIPNGSLIYTSGDDYIRLKDNSKLYKIPLTVMP